MRLKTLGNLALEASGFRRPVPLLLLAYLGLEGKQDRRYVAELFWPNLAKPLSNLSMALSHLRKINPDLIDSDNYRVSAKVDLDASDFLEALERRDLDSALDLYQGAFLLGVRRTQWGEELEEWIYRTREYFSGQLRRALLNEAEKLIDQGRLTDAEKAAKKIVDLGFMADFEPEEIRRLYFFFKTCGSKVADVVENEAHDLGIILNTAESCASFAQSQIQHNLPADLTPFIGQQNAVDRIKNLIDSRRIVTITGIGGSGKTRLALELARQIRDARRYKDGVFVVFLESLDTAERFHTELAKAFSVAVYEQTPLSAVLNYLADKNVLILLDNFEHMMNSVSSLTLMLRNCPGLSLVVTSREVLALQGEAKFRLSGLDYQPPVSSPDLASIQSLDAVQLFTSHMERSRVARLDDAAYTDILRICQQVEGHPLALELAASWLEILPLSEIRDLLHQEELLSADIRSLAERHRSVRATFDYSWNLLTSEQQTQLLNTALFQGGFTREAAKRVASLSLSQLIRLVNKSLLWVSTTGRFNWHPLLKAFALEKLEEDTDLKEEVKERFARYYFDLLLEQQRDFDTSSAPLRTLQKEMDNLAVAWHLHVDLGELGLLTEVTEAVCYIHEKLVYLQEGLNLLNAAISKFEGMQTPRTIKEQEVRALLGKVYFSKARLLTHQTHFELAWQAADISSSYSTDPATLFEILIMKAQLRNRQGRSLEARAVCLDALEFGKKFGRDHLALRTLALIEGQLGNFDEACKYLETVLDYRRRNGPLFIQLTVLSNLGGMYKLKGSYSKARDTLEEGLGLAIKHDVQSILPHYYSELIQVALAQGANEEVKQIAEQILAQPAEKMPRFSLVEILSVRAKLNIGVYNNLDKAYSDLVEALSYLEEKDNLRNTSVFFLSLADFKLEQAQTMQRPPQDAFVLLQLVRKHPTFSGAYTTEVNKRLARLEQELSKHQLGLCEKQTKQLEPLSLYELAKTMLNV